MSNSAPSRRIAVAPGFELDPAGERLWRDGEAVPLRPKSLQVLRHLSSKPGELVSIEELLDVAWPGTAVTPSTLTNVINELRRVLGEDTAAPKYIQTVFRRGYRWLAAPSVPEEEIPAERGDTLFVGRGAELRKLAELAKGAAAGRRSTVFLGGDPGIGKTTLVEEFVRSVEAGGGLVARGAAVESHGVLEPFLPFFNAIDDLVPREREWLVPLLARCAPNWLAQMPWVAGPEAARNEPRETNASSMLREGAVLWEAIAAERPLVLVLEDMHIADEASVGMLGYLAERTSAARLVVLGTYRAAQAIATDHPVAALVRRLQQGRRAQVLQLSPLSKAEIHDWLARRFSSDALASTLAGSMERVSEGNPLFLSAFVAHAIERGILCEENGAWQAASNHDAALRELPDDLRGIVEAQLETLGPELTATLEVASAAGLRFVAQDVGGGMDRPAEVADALCHRLAQSRHFVRAVGEVVRPDGTRSGEYEFVHSLYRRACYERLAPARRQLVHARIALSMEKAYGTARSSIAQQLATQFEAADDLARSIDYLNKAASIAVVRNELSEMQARLDQAREQLRKRPQSRERDLQEIAVHFTRSVQAGVDPERYASEFYDAFESAERLALRVGQQDVIFATRMGLAIGLVLMGKTEEAELLSEQLLAMSESELPTHRHQALVVSSHSLTIKGDLERSAALQSEAVTLDPAPGLSPTMDFRSWGMAHYAYTLTFLGRLREADEWMKRAIEIGEKAELLPGLSLIENTAADMYLIRRDPDRAEAHNRRAGELQTQLIGKPIRRTRAFAELLARSFGSSTKDCDSMDARHGRSWTPWPAHLATAQRETGRLDDARRTIAMGFRHSVESSAALFLAELHRELGEIALADAANSEEKATELAELQFREAVRIARHQHARLFELRATSALARLLQQTGRSDEAGAEVKAVLAAFGNEDGVDVEEARALLR